MTPKREYEFSYLYWPASINKVNDLHITYKFLGKGEIDPKQIKTLMAKIGYPKYPLVFEWAPAVFGSRADGIKVLEFVKFDSSMTEHRDPLNEIFADNHPSYRPHISVSDELWNTVRDNNLSLADVVLKIGPLELKVKGKIYKLD